MSSPKKTLKLKGLGVFFLFILKAKVFLKVTDTSSIKLGTFLPRGISHTLAGVSPIH